MRMLCQMLPGSHLSPHLASELFLYTPVTIQAVRKPSDDSAFSLLCCSLGVLSSPPSRFPLLCADLGSVFFANAREDLPGSIPGLQEDCFRHSSSPDDSIHADGDLSHVSMPDSNNGELVAGGAPPMPGQL